MTRLAEHDVLTRDECFELLRFVSIGRVIHTDRALPTLTPARFVWERGDVALRADRYSTLGRLTTGTVVAFEVDDFHTQQGFGRSVVLTGRVTVTEVATDEHPKERLIRLRPELMCGRRMAAGAGSSGRQGNPPHDFGACLVQGSGGESPTD